MLQFFMIHNQILDWKCLVAKCLRPYLSQFCTPIGQIKSYSKSMLKKLNSFCREVVLQAACLYLPKAYPFSWDCFSLEHLFLMESFAYDSAIGVKQGDPPSQAILPLAIQCYFFGNIWSKILVPSWWLCWWWPTECCQERPVFNWPRAGFLNLGCWNQF